jgi:hypothetical protein
MLGVTEDSFLRIHTSKAVYDRLVADILGFAAYPGRWDRTRY